MIKDSTGITVSRRTAFTGAGLALAAVGLGETPEVQAAAMGAVEAANVKVVEDFVKGWSSADATGAKLAAYMTDNGEFRFENKSAVTGKAALTAAFDAYLADGKRYEMKVLETFAKGPVVVHSRRETAVTRGAIGNAEALVGIFVVHDGKIMIWENFTIET